MKTKPTAGNAIVGFLLLPILLMAAIALTMLVVGILFIDLCKGTLRQNESHERSLA